MRIVNVRILSQAVFLVLFVWCLYLAAAPRIAGYPAQCPLVLEEANGVYGGAETGCAWLSGGS